jgi:hypothetical protein
MEGAGAGASALAPAAAPTEKRLHGADVKRRMLVLEKALAVEHKLRDHRQTMHTSGAQEASSHRASMLSMAQTLWKEQEEGKSTIAHLSEQADKLEQMAPRVIERINRENEMKQQHEKLASLQFAAFDRGARALADVLKAELPHALRCGQAALGDSQVASSMEGSLNNVIKLAQQGLALVKEIRSNSDTAILDALENEFVKNTPPKTSSGAESAPQNGVASAATAANHSSLAK